MIKTKRNFVELLPIQLLENKRQTKLCVIFKFLFTNSKYKHYNNEIRIYLWLFMKCVYIYILKSDLPQKILPDPPLTETNKNCQPLDKIVCVGFFWFF